MIHIGDIVFHTVTAPKKKKKKSLEENKHQYIEKATFLSRKNRAFKQTLKVTKKLYTPKIQQIKKGIQQFSQAYNRN